MSPRLLPYHHNTLTAKSVRFVGPFFEARATNVCSSTAFTEKWCANYERKKSLDHVQPSFGITKDVVGVFFFPLGEMFLRFAAYGQT
jgi:hypothetical protein